MLTKTIHVVTVLALLGTSAAPAMAADGAAIFDRECADCHSLAGKQKKGPSLAGIIGRQAGSVADFANYSAAMKASGAAWSAERLDAYIADPRKAVAGGSMKYDGLASAEERRLLIGYLQSRRQ